MPHVIAHIDAIARQKQRDVLFLVFSPEAEREVDWEALPIRNQVIGWLDANGIGWCPCGHFANTSMLLSYRGQIYLDVPFDEDNPTYQRLRDYLEHRDGSMVFPDARFFVLPLVKAMENADHDAPGFWVHWADNF